jgi:hypothetical protein
VKAGALSWLLERSNPAVRLFTLIDVMGRSPEDQEVSATRERILSYRPVTILENAQRGKGYWPPDDSSYNPKFTATVWQLMLLGELGAPRTPWIESAVERFMDQHQMENGAFCWRRLGGRGKIEEEPCLSGNMLRTLLVFGYGDDKRVTKALNWLPEFQFQDGGWNCDYPSNHPTHSSFMSTIEPLWAYSEIPRSRRTKKLKRSVDRAAEFLLAHRVYKSHRDWRPVELRHMNTVLAGNLVTKFHFPMYYYYDALHALRVLTKLGYGDDERISDAVHLLLSKKTPDGEWLLEGDWVRERKDKTRKTLVNIEHLHEPSKWVTLNCYRVLAKIGDLELPSRRRILSHTCPIERVFAARVQ